MTPKDANSPVSTEATGKERPLRRFPLKVKFAVLQAGFVLALGIVIAINVLAAKKMTESLSDVSDRRFPRYSIALELANHFESINRLFEDAVGTGERSLLDHCVEQKADLLEFLLKMKEHSSPVEVEQLEKIRLDFITYYSAATDLAQAALLDANDASGSLSQLENPKVAENREILTRLRPELQLRFDQLVATQQAQARLSILDTTAEIEKQSKIAVAIGLLSSLLLLWFLVQSTRRIIVPISALSQLTARVARGDFDIEIEVPLLCNDEVGDLAAAFRLMTRGLRETTVSKSYVDKIIESMADMLVVVNPDGRIRTVNRAALSLLGYEPQELVGRPFCDLVPDVEGLAGVGGVDPGDMTFFRHSDRVYLAKDGRTIPVSLSASVLRADDGHIEGIVCLAQDRTEYQKAEEELRKANAELAGARDQALAASQTKSTFLANMSHELRTPLNAVIGYSEMLQEEAEDEGMASFIPDLKKIQAAGKHLLGLINDILDISKIEAGKIQLYIEDFEIGDLVRDVASTIQPLIDKNANRLIVSSTDGIGKMHADMTRVRQVLFNLLSNASKFTEKGTVTLSVRREETAGSAWVVFDVVDTGIGMTPEQLERVFEPFQQAEASTTRKYGGTGLGLTISRHFCRMMGGDLSVVSQAGVGTTFTSRLPAIVIDPKDAVHAPSEPLAEAKVETGKDAATVLVIDDDPNVRDLLQRFLTKEGYHVQVASGGEEGLRLAREIRPAAITLDVMMPSMDGWEVLTALKAEPELADIPVCMLTMVEDHQLGYSLGVADYLTKPIDFSRLSAIMVRYLQPGLHSRVLIVDDDPAVRDVARKSLEKLGMEVREAENGQVALDRLAEERPDLILLDLMMPVLDGFDFVGKLHTREEWATIPIIVLTSWT